MHENQSERGREEEEEECEDFPPECQTRKEKREDEVENVPFFPLDLICSTMKRSVYLVGFDNNSFHPDDGEPTSYNGTNRSIAFPTTEPLRTIRITSNERVHAVRRASVFCHFIVSSCSPSLTKQKNQLNGSRPSTAQSTSMNRSSKTLQTLSGVTTTSTMDDGEDIPLNGKTSECPSMFVVVFTLGVSGSLLHLSLLFVLSMCTSLVLLKNVVVSAVSVVILNQHLSSYVLIHLLRTLFDIPCRPKHTKILTKNARVFFLYSHVLNVCKTRFVIVQIRMGKVNVYLLNHGHHLQPIISITLHLHPLCNIPNRPRRTTAIRKIL